MCDSGPPKKCLEQGDILIAVVILRDQPIDQLRAHMRRFLTCATATVLCAFVFLITLPFEAGARMVPQTTVLFDQVDDYDGRFFAFIGATNADNDPTVADDFVVPGGETWTISEVFIDGSYVALPDPSPDGDPICLTADIGFWNNGVDRHRLAM